MDVKIIGQRFLTNSTFNGKPKDSCLPSVVKSSRQMFISEEDYVAGKCCRNALQMAARCRGYSICFNIAC